LAEDENPADAELIAIAAGDDNEEMGPASRRRRIEKKPAEAAASLKFGMCQGQPAGLGRLGAVLPRLFVFGTTETHLNRSHNPSKK
jgi:hypothetical protein